MVLANPNHNPKVGYYTTGLGLSTRTHTDMWLMLGAG